MKVDTAASLGRFMGHMGDKLAENDDKLGWWWKKLNLPKGVSPNAVWEYGK